ncbi:MAG: tRNA lysidine(34) synthetase TilS [Firmicutes bacterium]|nr:tRNA lysidine(34) synthetase TilS [Bacillota bacterium]
MLERVDSFIREQKLLAPGDRLVVAVSGGPDSVCLLHIMHRLSTRWDFSLIVAHLEHGLRGVASVGDALYVQRLASRLGWPLVLERRDIGGIIRRQGGSVQDVCRQERLAFLEQTARVWGAQAILLAHHAGDQAETLLLHLLRGAGTSGLAAMAARDIAFGDTAFVRPLLRESKAAILAYLREQGIGYRVDVSNATTDYTRNQVRLEIMPRLASINPEVELALVRTAELLQGEDRYLEQVAQGALQQCKQGHHPFSLSTSRLADFPLAIQRRVLRLVWQELSGGPQDLMFTHVENALTLLGRQVGSVTSWPANWQVRRSYDTLVWEKGDPPVNRGVFELPLPGRVGLADGQITASLLSISEFSGYENNPNVAYCDLESLATTQLQVRYWRPGDFFYPLGLKGSKKLQDYFTDIKLDRRERQLVPLVVRGEDIVWIAGHRLDHRWRITEGTKRLLRLEYQKTVAEER